MKIEIKKLISKETGSVDYYHGKKCNLFEISLKDLKEFISIPWKISWYKSNSSNKVFPSVIQEMVDLNPDFKIAKRFFPGYNPFFTHLKFLQYYVSYEDGKPSGRVAAIIDNNYLEKEFDGTIGIIGLFESENIESGRELLKAAVQDLKRNGALKIIGPMRFNASGEVGLLIDGFDIAPMTMEPYNPPYYQEIFQEFGEKENDWFSFIVDFKSAESYMERIMNFSRNGINLENMFQNNGINIREITLKNFKEEVEKIKKIYNSAWDTVEHPQFEKVTDEEFTYIANNLRTALIPEFVFLVEEVNNSSPNVIGISVTIPNVNEVIKRVDTEHFPNFVPSNAPIGVIDLKRDLKILSELKKTLKEKKFKTSRVFILGTLKKKVGLDAILYKRTYENSKRYGISFGSASQIADTNLNMVNPLLKMGKIGCTWRVYRIK